MGFRYTYQNFMMEELIPRSNKSKNCNAQKITYKNANRHDTFWRYKNIALIDFDCADIEIRFLMFPRIQIHNLSGECIRNAFEVRDPWSAKSELARNFQNSVGPSPVRDFQDIFVLVHFSPRFSNSSWLWSSPRFLIFFDSGSSRTYFNRFRSTDPLLGIKADYPWNFAINRDQIVLKLLFSVEIKSSPGSKWWQQFQVIEGMKLNIGFDNVII